MGIFKQVLKMVLVALKVLNTKEAYEQGKTFGENIIENSDIILNLVNKIVTETGMASGSRSIGAEKLMLKELLSEIEKEAQ